MEFDEHSLADLVHKPIEGTIRTLLVEDWFHASWHSKQTDGLLQVCRQYRVQHLIFVNESNRVGLKKLAKLAGDEKIILPHLRSIKVVYKHYSPSTILAALISCSRVVEITWKMVRRHDGDYSVHMSMIVSRLRVVRIFETPAFVRSIRFQVPALGSDDSYINVVPNCIDYYALEGWLQRNRRAFWNCKRAVIVLLGLNRRRKIGIDHNLVHQIVQMVWETRGTQVWIQNDPK
jgi:hypothetical protein